MTRSTRKLTCTILALVFLALAVSAWAAGPTSPVGADVWDPNIIQSPASYTETILLPDGRSIDKVTVPGRPPRNFKALAIEPPVANLAMGINVLPNVPAFDWSYGCSPTAAAMMMGYYDNTGYPNMYAGPTNGGVCPLTNSAWGTGECPLSATHNSYDNRTIYGHVDDYWRSYGNCDPDPFIGNWPEHVQGECTADYMGTNQSLFGQCDGSTGFHYYTDGSPLYDYTNSEPTERDGCHGMRLFVESRGYGVAQNFSQYIYGYGGKITGFTFADFQHEIDAGQPVMIQVTGHSMVGFGYDANTSTIYIHDTWDHNDHQMTWGGSYSGLQHYGVAVVRPTGGIQVDPVSFSPDGGTYDSPQTVVITCPTDGAVIHYTTNGLDPTEQDPIVTGPVLVDHSLMLRARAWKNGFAPSEVKSAEYFLGGSVVLHVIPVGNDANDGLSWANSKRTVQVALNAALPGDQVWVAAGTYNERVSLARGVALYGGFAGAETDLLQRNWITSRTILDGGAAGTVVTSPMGARTTTRIDGFTIQNGNSGWGGGVYCNSSSPTIANNTITGNSASNGGGIYCSYASPTIAKNTIARNYGGGIFCNTSSATIANNTIIGNSGDGHEGSGNGIYCNCCSPTITGNMISGNRAYSGGGILCDHSSPTITNNTITVNSATNGGGIYCVWSSPTVSNSIIAFNSAGISSYQGSPVLRNNDVYGNGRYDYSGLSAGAGDISADPTLVSNEYGDLHIQSGSPCINAGWNDAPGLPATDIDDQPRVQGGTVDIGADESDGTTWPPVSPAVVRVSPTGNDSNNGSSWSSAKRTVQAGINAASSLGGEVWVQSGTYAERITLLPYAYVYGGFAGSETLRSERNWSANRTILDGEGGGSVVTASCGHLLGAIDGFTIRNGNAPAQYYGGGGIRCKSSSATIMNNTIVGNISFEGGGISCNECFSTITNNTITGNSARVGGGIHCYAGSPKITNNTITGNSASGQGGGVANQISSPVIANNIIAFNSSAVGGTGDIFRSNCVYGNMGGDYPVGDGNISLDPMLVSKDFGDLHIQAGSPCVNAGWNDAPGLPATDMDGQARVQGGTVDIGADESDGTTWPPVSPQIVRVSPTGDDANDGSDWLLAKKMVQAGINAAAAVGGEVWVKSGTYNERITLRPCAYVYGGFAGSETSISERNWSANVTILDGAGAGSVVTTKCGYLLGAIDGFAIRNGSNSGVYCYWSSPIIANNAITGNNATNGGGIYCYYSYPVISNSTITENDASSNGGGIYGYASSPTITNSIIMRNSASNGGGIYYYYCSYPSPMITNCTITDNGVALDGGGMYFFSSDPYVSNNIVAFNVPGLYKSGTGKPSPALRNNDVYGNSGYDYLGLSAGTGDISLDPLFVDGTTGNYHLRPQSPCINTGWNDAPGLPTTDMDGEARIWAGTADIGADEFQAYPANLAKKMKDNSWLAMGGAAVSAAFTDMFYLEADDRSSGIRADKPSHGLTDAMRVDITGKIKTDPDGERYIEVATAEENGTGSVTPVMLINRGLGGADWEYEPITGAGQQGVTGVGGLNNIGLLVTVCGRVTEIEPVEEPAIPTWFKIDDGSGRNIKCIAEDGSPVISDSWLNHYAVVTGISSCEFEDGILVSKIRLKKNAVPVIY